MSKSKSQPVLKSTAQRYVQPLGDYSNEVISGFFVGKEGCVDVACIDGKQRPFWPVTLEELESLERSQKNAALINKPLRFSVWYKEDQGSKAKLLRHWKDGVSRSKNTKAKVNRRLRTALKNREIFPGCDMEVPPRLHGG